MLAKATIESPEDNRIDLGSVSVPDHEAVKHERLSITITSGIAPITIKVL